MSIRSLTELDAAADVLVDGERLGKPTPLPEDWTPGSLCPSTGVPCSDHSCWEGEACRLRPTLTSRLGAQAGRYLALWARRAGAEGMCAGCAFREGTRANRTDHTIIDIVECLRTGGRFMCHDGLRHGEAPREVCRGWAALAAGEE